MKPKPKQKPAKQQKREAKLNMKQFYLLRHAVSVLSLYGYLSDSSKRSIVGRLDRDCEKPSQLKRALKKVRG